MSVFRVIADTFLLPRRCVCCGALLLKGEEVACVVCLAAVERCGLRSLDFLQNHAGLANAVAPAGIAEAWMAYDRRVASAEIIRSVKFHDTPRNGRVLGRLFGRDLLHRDYSGMLINASDIDVLLPMPMHFSKRLQRGYNQSEEIAAGIARVIGCAVGDNLVALRGHSTQTRLGTGGRRLNIEGCFGVRHPEELEGLHVALVDDIITTGASMCEAAQALSRGGARPASISILALGATV